MYIISRARKNGKASSIGAENGRTEGGGGAEEGGTTITPHNSRATNRAPRNSARNDDANDDDDGDQNDEDDDERTKTRRRQRRRRRRRDDEDDGYQRTATTYGSSTTWASAATSKHRFPTISRERRRTARALARRMTEHSAAILAARTRPRLQSHRLAVAFDDSFFVQIILGLDVSATMGKKAMP